MANTVSRPHVSDHGDGPFRHVDVGQYPNHEHVAVQNDLGATAIGGAQFGQHQQHPHGHNQQYGS